MKKIGKLRSVLSFFREIFIVLSGVLIALLVNDWKEDRNNDSYVDSAITAIASDIDISKDVVENTFEKHMEIIDSIQLHLSNDTVSLLTVIGKAGGVQYPQMKNISTKYLIANKANLLDYEIIATLMDIETGALWLEKKFDNLMVYIYENMNETDYDSKFGFLVRFYDVVHNERMLIEYYDVLLKNKDIKKRLKNAKKRRTN